jgi:acyl dehydratase
MLGPHRTVDRGFELELEAAMSNSSGPAWRATTTVLWRRAHEKRQQPTTPMAACALPHRALWQLAATAGRRYSRVSGDLNPIHLTRLSARLFGYRQPIAHGMWLLARIVATLVREAPPPPRVLEASFLRPVLLPAEAVLAAQRTSSGIDFALLSADGAKAYLEGRLGALGADHVS